MKNFRASMKGKLKYLGHLFYSEQVKFSFSHEVLKATQAHRVHLPAGYAFRPRSPESVDLEFWARLLNSDGHFGYWDGRRIKTDILQQLIHPEAVSLLFFGDTLIGCGCACVSQTAGVGLLMWMLIVEGHRGRGLARPLLLRTLALFAREGYRKAVATTDAFRLSALYLYLSSGAKPEYDSLYSLFQWWRINIAMKGFISRKK